MLPGVASAHPEGATGVALDVQDDHVAMALDIPLDELGLALDRELTPKAARADLGELGRYVREHVDAVGVGGEAWEVRLDAAEVGRPKGIPSLLVGATLAPPDGVVTAFTLRYGAVVDDLETHRAFVTLAQDGGEPRSLDIVTFRHKNVAVTAPGVEADRSHAFGVMLSEGVHHIGSGTDHVLFLLTLLLPAPLLAVRRRWVAAPSPWRAARRILHVVTAFAVGHSLTLAAAATGIVDIPIRPVEVVIALSIAVSAVHAVRPIVPGGAAWIAFGFGLVHGVAFAEVLHELGLSGLDLVLGLLGFNLGIELAQLLVVALVMPSLWLLSRTRLYTPFRNGTAAVAFVGAIGWALERAGAVETSPLAGPLDAVVGRPLAVAVALAVLAVLSYGIAPGPAASGRSSCRALPVSAAKEVCKKTLHSRESPLRWARAHFRRSFKGRGTT